MKLISSVVLILAAVCLSDAWKRGGKFAALDMSAWRQSWGNWLNNVDQSKFKDIDWANVDWKNVDWTDTDFSGNAWAKKDGSDNEWESKGWANIDWRAVDWTSPRWNNVNWGGIDWVNIDWANIDMATFDWASENIQKRGGGWAEVKERKDMCEKMQKAMGSRMNMNC